MVFFPDIARPRNLERCAMAGHILERYVTTTDRIVVIQWSEWEDVTHRQQRWGGHLSSWKINRPYSDVYRIPKAISIARIEAALRDVLRKSDKAVLVYPHGKTRGGASAMRMRTYGL